ncbi:PH domain-containing protein [Tenacibaculum finnmarkense]|uniref:PH domain-containing protein n=1 Tax=Tenacibaculum finnmarkense TaxID=2781243 RepID=UPI001EFA897B|nr:PH domain-containing protein [Tenacibaculum finnmarkense]MCG8226367.1 PH domain-containing protein [Tenacibaculum finnmarkense genomovar finnmarkense]
MEEFKKLKVKHLYAIYKQLFNLFVIVISIVIFFLTPLMLFELKYIAMVLFIIFFLKSLYGYLYYRFLIYELYSDRMIFKKGVFSTKTDFLELYRIKDYKKYQSLFMRIFKMQTIILITSDKSNPIIKISGIKNDNIAEIIRLQVEKLRKIKGVREFD